MASADAAEGIWASTCRDVNQHTHHMSLWEGPSPRGSSVTRGNLWDRFEEAALNGNDPRLPREVKNSNLLLKDGTQSNPSFNRSFQFWRIIDFAIHCHGYWIKSAGLTIIPENAWKIVFVPSRLRFEKTRVWNEFDFASHFSSSAITRFGGPSSLKSSAQHASETDLRRRCSLSEYGDGGASPGLLKMKVCST